MNPKKRHLKVLCCFWLPFSALIKFLCSVISLNYAILFFQCLPFPKGLPLFKSPIHSVFVCSGFLALFCNKYIQLKHKEYLQNKNCMNNQTRCFPRNSHPPISLLRTLLNQSTIEKKNYGEIERVRN